LLKSRSARANVLKWDLAETAAGRPFKEIVESDMFVNCIYLSSKIPNFVDMKSLETPDRKLSVIHHASVRYDRSKQSRSRVYGSNNF
jgi:hypothetical protein